MRQCGKAQSRGSADGTVRWRCAGAVPPQTPCAPAAAMLPGPALSSFQLSPLPPSYSSQPTQQRGIVSSRARPSWAPSMRQPACKKGSNLMRGSTTGAQSQHLNSPLFERTAAAAHALFTAAAQSLLTAAASFTASPLLQWQLPGSNHNPKHCSGSSARPVLALASINMVNGPPAVMYSNGGAGFASMLASITGPHPGAGAATGAAATHSSSHAAIPDLTGKWVKDRTISDSMSPAMDLMQLGGITRQAVKLIRGVNIAQDEREWSMAVFSVISWFKVTERYPLDGSPTTCKRRDLRRGKHTGRLLPGKRGPHGGLVLDLKWDEPHGGTGTDEFVLAPAGTAAAQVRGSSAAPAAHAGPPATGHLAKVGGHLGDDVELHIYSTIVVGGKTCSYRSVYHK